MIGYCCRRHEQILVEVRGEGLSTCRAGTSHVKDHVLGRKITRFRRLELGVFFLPERIAPKDRHILPLKSRRDLFWTDVIADIDELRLTEFGRGQLLQRVHL